MIGRAAQAFFDTLGQVAECERRPEPRRR